MTNISHNTMNTLISRVPCFSFALHLFHTSRLSGVSCPFAVFICFKEIWFTQRAMQLGRLLLFHILRCFSLFYPLSVFFAVTIFFFALRYVPAALSRHIFFGTAHNKGEKRKRKQIRCSLCKTAEGEDVR